MTELGQQFVEALRAQGYNLTFDAEDLIIHREGVRLRVVPLVGLREPGAWHSCWTRRSRPSRLTSGGGSCGRRGPAARRTEQGGPGCSRHPGSPRSRS